MILTGTVHDTPALTLAALARDSEISTLALLEPTDSSARSGSAGSASPRR